MEVGWEGCSLGGKDEGWVRKVEVGREDGS